MLTISQAQSEAQITAARELMREYTTWAFTLIEGSDKAPTFQDLEAELESLPGIYGLPAGRLLLATQNGEAAGCVCLRRIDATTAELKRLYVRPAFRGQHIGWRLVNQLLAEARESGYRRIILDSHVSMKTAHTLYETVGFWRVPASADFPASLKPEVVFMACDLPA
ncbi:MAG: GNAT family N-acetyltransferase [Anaerolineae bacterium]|nr:GNAT family N-acetyltransferase [Anaerolineae bacterium]MDT8305400.1 GNAT family N-acetyltransferase [Anaerolineae bacterium]